MGEWSEWSACSAKERFAGCDYGSTPAGWRYRGASGPLPLNESTAGAARGGASLRGMEAKMRRKSAALASATRSSNSRSRSGPEACVGGRAGRFPCRDVDLVSWTPASELTPDPGAGGSQEWTVDTWGWTSRSGKEWGIQSVYDGIAFLNLGCPGCELPTGPAAGVEDFLPGAASTWRDVKVYDHYALVVSEADLGLQIFDLHRLETKRGRAADGSYEPDAVVSTFGSAHNVVVNEETARAYVVGAGRGAGPAFGSERLCNGGLYGVDVLDPLEPKILGCLYDEAYVHDAQCVVYRGPDADHFGQEICFAFTGEESYGQPVVRVLDVTDAANVKVVSFVVYPEEGFSHQGWLSCDHATLFVDDELDEQFAWDDEGSRTKTIVLDVGDLDLPFYSFTHAAGINVVDHNQYVNGAYLYQADYEGGLRILDISQAADPTDPRLVEVAYFDVYPDGDGLGYAGAWGVFPFLPSGRVLVNDVTGGTAVVRPNNLKVETRSRAVAAAGPQDACPLLFEERACRGPTASPVPSPTAVPVTERPTMEVPSRKAQKKALKRCTKKCKKCPDDKKKKKKKKEKEKKKKSDKKSKKKAKACKKKKKQCEKACRAQSPANPMADAATCAALVADGAPTCEACCPYACVERDVMDSVSRYEAYGDFTNLGECVCVTGGAQDYTLRLPSAESSCAFVSGDYAWIEGGGGDDHITIFDGDGGWVSGNRGNDHIKIHQGAGEYYPSNGVGGPGDDTVDVYEEGARVSGETIIAHDGLDCSTPSSIVYNVEYEQAYECAARTVLGANPGSLSAEFKIQEDELITQVENG